MISYSIYDKSTGMVLRYLSCDSDQLAGNLGEKEGAFEGTLDPLSQRVVQLEELDEHGQPVLYAEEYQPPAPEPSSDYQWDEKQRRWVLIPEISARRQLRQRAIEKLQQLDSASVRALREIRLAEIKGEQADPDSAAKLADIEAQAKRARQDL